LSENADGSPANYYFTDITLKQSSKIEIVGKVNIFITGKLDARNGTDITATGDPGDFAIYSSATGSSNGDITLHNSSELHGVIYAPKSTLEMKNSAALYGAVFGSEIVFHNSFTLFYDEALKDKYATVSDDVALISWEEE